MRKIVGIRLEEHGKVYHFDSGHFVLKKKDKVVVNTEQGQAFGVVCIEPKVPGDDLPDRPLKKVQRIATKRDLERYEKKCQSEKDIFVFCEEKIKQRALPMCMVSVSRLFDGSKIIVYFTADGRVDFRELVKDLVQNFRTRVEMRQIGVRHQAKMVGGLGTCGRQLCCTSFLNTFEPVSIRMAKKQNISLNPSKISGMCSRLMCCLTYEYDYYDKLRKDLPKIGKVLKTKKGEGKVVRQNLLRETITVVLENNEELEIPFREIDT
jgi:cell fate regulator YaaT (PSP1 superfamily)